MQATSRLYLLWRGIFFALLACFIWGLIFIVPQMMQGFDPFEVAIGRYAVYGLVSLVIFLPGWCKGRYRYDLSVWLKAIYLSFVCSIGYYTCVVVGVRYATPAVAALILGICPITIALWGNQKQKECSYRSLIFPSFLIVIGLLMINVPSMVRHDHPWLFATGIGCSVMALIFWTLYAVANARFLKGRTDIASSDWSTMVGVATLGWVFISFVVAYFLSPKGIFHGKLTTWDTESQMFLCGCAILGLLCSWVGAFLWNKASIYLPVSMAGQLMIFETIFGLIFFYLVKRELPGVLEFCGILLFLIAVAQAIRNFSQRIQVDEPLMKEIK